MRRQNRSCDQCRKAKRACDAPSLWDIQRNTARIRSGVDAGTAVSLAEEHIEDIESRALRCSYCLRTRKECTFHWVRSQLQTGPAAAAAAAAAAEVSQSGASNRRMPDAGRAKAKRQRIRPQQSESVPAQTPLPGQAIDVNAGTLLDILQVPANGHDLVGWPPMDANFTQFSNFPTTTFDSMPVSGVFDPSSFDAGLNASILDGLDPHGAPQVTNLSYTPTSDTTNQGLKTGQHSGVDEDQQDHNWQMFHPQSVADSTMKPSPSVSNSYESDGSSRATSMRHYSDSMSGGYCTSISPFSATQTMVTTTNRNMITDNLMRIYHDVLEHALSCWLSEETCPYRPNAIGRQSPSVSWLASDFQKLNVLNHYDPKQQNNRIYRRVIKLDQVAQSNKLIRLTRSEDRAASKALHLAIMAFATQWAQGSQRERDRFPSTMAPFGRSEFDDFNDDFDRTLQRTFWAQAKRALQDCADTECFRVVCADLIMGLAQKPMDEDEFADTRRFSVSPSNVDPEAAVYGGEGSIASQISEIIAREGPPIFMERAARKMHALKFQYEARETGVLDSSKSSLGLEKASKAESLGVEDRGTIGLIYWMTVMFDTVSSSMNGRPVVVSDEECQHDPSYQKTTQNDPSAGEFILHPAQWWADLFHRDDRAALHYPCSAEKATKGVVAAAPTKVILFRHVSYLQNTVRSRARGETVEKVILNAMAVYRHWNVMYGAFFRELVDNYDTVPSHIQSWFVCVVAHFHCAALLLADLIELVDQNNLGVELASQVRTSVDVVSCLRKDSAMVLSDLARVSTNPRAPDASDLHFAIAEGSILTEPWTMILIRAFTKAAILHLADVEDSVRHDPAAIKTPAIQSTVARCEDSTRALWCLGKKSDMARNIGEILSTALGPYLVQSNMPIISY